MNSQSRVFINLTRCFAAALALALGGGAHAAIYTTETLQADGRTRSFQVHDFSASSPAPVVILLHGAGGNADNMAFMSEFDEVASRENIIAVYPNGTSRGGQYLTWNATHCCSYAMHNQIDDVTFISMMIDQLIASGRADPTRIYVTGMSNGGMMTHVLGRELSLKVAAIGTVVGTLFGDEPQPQASVPAIIINGETDVIVPVAGGPIAGEADSFLARFLGRNASDADAAPAVEQAEYWAAANGCQTIMQHNDAIAHSTYFTDCANDAEVEFHIVLGNGHAWPGGQAARPDADQPVQNFDASELIWQFFNSHTRAIAP